MFVSLRRLLRPATALALVCAAAGCGLLDTSSDTRAPLVTLTRPTRQAALTTTAAGDLLVSVQITPRGDANGVSEVGILLNNARVATAAAVGTPVKNTAGFFVYTYTAHIDLRGVRDGDYRLEAVAFDRFGARGTTEPVRLRVLNGSAGPLARLTEPLDGARVAGDVRVAVVPNPGALVTRVDFLVDGLTAFADSLAPYEWLWPSRLEGIGEHVLQARAYDGGVSSLTNAALVTVTDTTSGGGGGGGGGPIDPPPTPTFDPTCATAGCARFAATAPAPLAAPLAADAAGNVYAVTTAPSVLSWNSVGAVRWTRALAAASRLSPLVGTDGSVYVADETGRVTAISATGVDVWTYEAGSAVTGGLALTPAGQLAFGDARGRLHVVGIVSGISSAGFPATVSAAAIITPVAVLRSGDIAVTSADGLVTLMGSNGLKRWTSSENFGALVFGPVLSDVSTGGGIPSNSLTTVYVVNSGGRLAAINGGTGALLGSAILDDAPRAAPIVGPAGTVFALTSRSLTAYDEAAAGTLRSLWSTAVTGAASPSFDADGRIFLPTAADVAVLTAATGAVVTRYIAGASSTAAIVAPRGTYYAAAGTAVKGLYTGVTGAGVGRWAMFGRNARHTFRAEDAQ